MYALYLPEEGGQIRGKLPTGLTEVVTTPPPHTRQGLGVGSLQTCLNCCTLFRLTKLFNQVQLFLRFVFANSSSVKSCAREGESQTHTGINSLMADWESLRMSNKKSAGFSLSSSP